MYYSKTALGESNYFFSEIFLLMLSQKQAQRQDSLFKLGETSGLI